MIIQPENTPLCGQCCIATLLNITLKEAIKLIGHSHSTKRREILKHIPHKKIRYGKPKHRRPQNFTALCTAIPPHSNNVKNFHWLIFNNGKYYDSNIGVWWCCTMWEIVSYYEIKEI